MRSYKQVKFFDVSQYHVVFHFSTYVHTCTYKTTKVEIVQQQPTAMYVQPQRRYGSGDHGLVYAIIATLAVLFCCLYFPLICTIPAIFLAISVSGGRGGERDGGRGWLIEWEGLVGIGLLLVDGGKEGLVDVWVSRRWRILALQGLVDCCK